MRSNFDKLLGFGLILAVVTFPPRSLEADTSTNEGNFGLVEEVRLLREETQRLRQMIAPKDAVVAFHTEEDCPNGWEPYAPAYGRFIRGIDKSGGTDPSGRRVPGHQQSDAFQGHALGGPGSLRHQFLSGRRWSVGLVNSTISNGYAVLQVSGVGQAVSRIGGNNTGHRNEAVRSTILIDDGSHGKPRVATETRPRNVALLYCRKLAEVAPEQVQ